MVFIMIFHSLTNYSDIHIFISAHISQILLACAVNSTSESGNIQITLCLSVFVADLLLRVHACGLYDGSTI